MANKTIEPAEPAEAPSVWKMPAWMEPMRDFIRDTGGNSVEDLVNDHHTISRVNAFRAAMCVSVTDQVSLLYILARKGMLVGVSTEVQWMSTDGYTV